MTISADIRSLLQRLENWERSLSERETALAESVEARVADGVIQHALEAFMDRGQRLERQRVLELIEWLQRDFGQPTPTNRTLEILKKHVSSPVDRTPDRYHPNS